MSKRERPKDGGKNSKRGSSSSELFELPGGMEARNPFEEPEKVATEEGFNNLEETAKIKIGEVEGEGGRTEKIVEDLGASELIPLINDETAGSIQSIKAVVDDGISEEAPTEQALNEISDIEFETIKPELVSADKPENRKLDDEQILNLFQTKIPDRNKHKSNILNILSRALSGEEEIVIPVKGGSLTISALSIKELLKKDIDGNWVIRNGGLFADFINMITAFLDQPNDTGNPNETEISQPEKEALEALEKELSEEEKKLEAQKAELRRIQNEKAEKRNRIIALETKQKSTAPVEASTSGSKPENKKTEAELIAEVVDFIKRRISEGEDRSAIASELRFSSLNYDNSVISQAFAQIDAESKPEEEIEPKPEPKIEIVETKFDQKAVIAEINAMIEETERERGGALSDAEKKAIFQYFYFDKKEEWQEQQEKKPGLFKRFSNWWLEDSKDKKGIDKGAKLALSGILIGLASWAGMEGIDSVHNNSLAGRTISRGIIGPMIAMIASSEMVRNKIAELWSRYNKLIVMGGVIAGAGAVAFFISIPALFTSLIAMGLKIGLDKTLFNKKIKELEEALEFYESGDASYLGLKEKKDSLDGEEFDAEKFVLALDEADTEVEQEKEQIEKGKNRWKAGRALAGGAISAGAGIATAVLQKTGAEKVIEEKVFGENVAEKLQSMRSGASSWIKRIFGALSGGGGKEEIKTSFSDLPEELDYQEKRLIELEQDYNRVEGLLKEVESKIDKIGAGTQEAADSGLLKPYTEYQKYLAEIEDEITKTKNRIVEIGDTIDDLNGVPKNDTEEEPAPEQVIAPLNTKPDSATIALEPETATDESLTPEPSQDAQAEQTKTATPPATKPAEGTSGKTEGGVNKKPAMSGSPEAPQTQGSRLENAGEKSQQTDRQTIRRAESTPRASEEPAPIKPKAVTGEDATEPVPTAAGAESPELVEAKKTLAESVNNTPTGQIEKQSTEIEGMDAKYVVDKGLGVTHAFREQVKADPELGRALADQIGYQGKIGTPTFYKALGQKFGYIDEDGREVRVKWGGIKGNVRGMAAYQFVKEGDHYIVQEHHLDGDAWVATEIHNSNGEIFEGDTKDNIENPRYNKDEKHDYEYLHEKRRDTLYTDEEPIKKPKLVERLPNSIQRPERITREEAPTTLNQPKDVTAEPKERKNLLKFRPLKVGYSAEGAYKTEGAYGTRGEISVARGPDGRPWIVEDFTLVGKETVENFARENGYANLSEDQIRYVTDSYKYNLKSIFGRNTTEWEELSGQSAAKIMARGVRGSVDTDKELLVTLMQNFYGVTEKYPIDNGESVKDYLLRMTLEMERRGQLEEFNKMFDGYRNSLEEAEYKKIEGESVSLQKKNIGKIFPGFYEQAKENPSDPRIIRIQNITNGPVGTPLNMRIEDASPEMKPLIYHLQDLKKETGLVPKDGETVIQYIDRATTRAVSMGRVKEITLSDRELRKITKVSHEDEEYKPMKPRNIKTRHVEDSEDDYKPMKNSKENNKSDQEYKPMREKPSNSDEEYRPKTKRG